MACAPASGSVAKLHVMHTKTTGISSGGDNSQLNPEQPVLLTKAEVAKLIRKSTRTVEHWVNAGYLSSIRISHSVLFDREQVLEDLKRFETGGRRDRSGA